MKFVALSTVMLVFIGLIFASLFFDSSRARVSGPATTNQSDVYTAPLTGNQTSATSSPAAFAPAANPDSIFRGPVGTPHVIGPSGPPPSY